VEQYYELIFQPNQAEVLLHPLVAERYARIASTVGQPHPFPEIHDLHHPNDRTSRKLDELNELYAQLLREHHQ
jgi:hypothetical protein